MNFFSSIFSYLQETFTERLPYFPSNIRAALFIILFCFVATIELYLYIIFRRIDQFGKKRQLNKWQENVQNMLANLIVFDESDQVEDIVHHFYPRFKKLAHKNEVVNKILIQEILVYHKNFTGRTAEVLNILFKKLNLDKNARKKLKNRNWEIKIDGIREASEMELVDMADLILAYTDDENALLRMEAQAAYIKLAPSDPFRFLERAHERILDWHQLVLFEVITKSKKIEIPSFSKWLHSSNDTVVVLCLKLIDFYMQFDAEKELIRLLKHQNPKIVKLSVQILGKLEIEAAEKELFEMYFEQPDAVKIEILKAFGRISSGNYVDFLSSRIFSSGYNIKVAALRALKEFPNKGMQLIKELYQETTPQNQSLIKHVIDERIKA